MTGQGLRHRQEIYQLPLYSCSDQHDQTSTEQWQKLTAPSSLPSSLSMHTSSVRIHNRNEPAPPAVVRQAAKATRTIHNQSRFSPRVTPSIRPSNSIFPPHSSHLHTFCYCIAEKPRRPGPLSHRNSVLLLLQSHVFSCAA